MNQIKVMPLNGMKQANTVRFGKYFTVDIGGTGANGGASLKMAAYAENGKFIARSERAEISGIESGKNFVHSVGQAIQGFNNLLPALIMHQKANISQEALEYYKHHNKNLKNDNQILDIFSQREEGLKECSRYLKESTSGIVVLAPSPFKPDGTVSFANIKDIQGNSLKDVSFDSLAKLPGVAGKKEVKIIGVNDMFGVGAAAAQAIAEHPKYRDIAKTDGAEVVVIMTGGGTGAIRIRFDQEKQSGLKSLLKKNKNPIKVTLRASENGHIRTGLDKSSQIVEEVASASGLIGSFGARLGLFPDQIKALQDTGNAKIVTNFEEYNTLTKTAPFKEEPIVNDDIGWEDELYDLTESKSSNSSLTLKNISPENHKNAALAAIDKYLDAVAFLSHIKVTDGVKAVVITGPLVKGIKEYMKENGKDFETVLQQKIETLLDEAGKGMARASGFKIITDLNFPDNTVGGTLLVNSEAVDSYTRRATLNKVSQVDVGRNGPPKPYPDPVDPLAQPKISDRWVEIRPPKMPKIHVDVGHHKLPGVQPSQPWPDPSSDVDPHAWPRS